jgi:hypothetical protein
MTFKDLLGFDKLIAIPMIKIVYWVGNVGLVIALLMTLASLFTPAYYGVTGVSVFLGILGICFGFLIWRVSCEMWIVLFGIYDRLGEIRDQNKPSA